MKKVIYVIVVMLTIVLTASYGTFIFRSEKYKVSEMIVSKLIYGLEVEASNGIVNNRSVSVLKGETSTVLIKVTSLNNVNTKYGVDYKITKGSGSVKYASNTGWLPTGKISKNNEGTYEKVIKVIVKAESDITVEFTVTGGYIYNELTEVEEGYTRITEKEENITSYNEELESVVEKENKSSIYGGESINNYIQYPIDTDNTKNIWRIIGNYKGIGTKIIRKEISTTSKTTINSDLMSFYNTLEKQEKYIKDTDKFKCTKTTCESSSYSKIGIINISEYEMIGGINSYLSSKENYYGIENEEIKNITPTGIEETSTSSGLRPVVYLEEYVTVTGSGTVTDPYKLKLPEYSVTLNVINGSATLPSKKITRGEEATYEITANTGYKLVLSSNTCNGTLNGNIYTISNITENMILYAN